MNLNQLRIFFESAKHLSYTRAAKRLFISQPAVSSQVKHLEEVLRQQLFTKVGKKMHLTESGKVLFSYASKIFELEAEAEKSLNDIKEIQKGTLHVGTTKTYARYLMPRYMSTFHAMYPGISIHLSEGSSMEMIQSLSHMKIEIAIVASANYPKSLQNIALGHEEILLIVRPDHELAKQDSITIEKLSKIPLIMREEGSGTRRVIMEMFKKADCTPTILHEASNFGLIIELMEIGEGASFVVKSAVEKELEKGILKAIKIIDASLMMNVNIVYLSEKTLSKTGRAFINMLLSTRSSTFVH